MKDGKFESSDFSEVWRPLKAMTAVETMHTANALLPALKEQWREEMLKDASFVYTTIGWQKSLCGPWFTIGRRRYDTHTAKLVDIKEIEE